MPTTVTLTITATIPDDDSHAADLVGPDAPTPYLLGRNLGLVARVRRGGFQPAPTITDLARIVDHLAHWWPTTITATVAEDPAHYVRTEWEVGDGAGARFTEAGTIREWGR